MDLSPLKNNFLFSESICIPEKVFNFTSSDNLVTNQSTLCLACLFNAEGPEPGTAWLMNGQNITPSSGIAKVNGNGTLVIVQPLKLPVLVFTCQHGGSMFNITLNGECAVLAAWKRDCWSLIVIAEETLINIFFTPHVVRLSCHAIIVVVIVVAALLQQEIPKWRLQFPFYFLGFFENKAKTVGGFLDCSPSRDYIIFLHNTFKGGRVFPNAA